MNKRTTPKTLPLVWLRLTKFVVDDLDTRADHPEATKAFCMALDELLDNLAGQDAFGTESQCDPRGDQRN